MMIEKHVDQGGHVEYIDPNETRIAELEADNERLRAELDDLQQAGQVAVVDPLKAKVEQLQEEVADLLDKSFRRIAYLCKSDDDHSARDIPWAGWWDTQASTEAKMLGDRLVELGTWERHPDGYGRRWFYRPIDKAEAVTLPLAEN